MRRTRSLAPWGWGAVVATLLFAVLLVFASYQYIGSDDAPILRAFMGYEGGTPATFHLYIHTAFAWLLYGLAVLFPGVAWFSILQLVLLWLSQVVIVKSLAQLAAMRGRPMWTGAALGALFLAAFTVYVTCRITYTTTSALCGAAAVAQLASVDFTAQKRRAVVWPMVGSALLLLCAYCLRQISVLPPLCFWLLMLMVKLLAAFGKRKNPWKLAKPVLIGALITAGLFALFVGVRAVDIRMNNAEDFLDWQNARIDLFDYTDFDTTTTDETLAKIGWSRDEFTLVTYWYFMDDNITADAFRTLKAQQDADDAALTLGDRLNNARLTVDDCLRTYPAIRWGLWAALLMAVAALLMQVRGGRANLWPMMGILAAVAGGGLLLFYLGYTGRLPMRAALSVLLPMAAYLFCALPLLAESPAKSGSASAPDTPQQAMPSPQSAFSGTLRTTLLALSAFALAACLWASVNAVLVTAPNVRPLTEEEDNYGTLNLTDLDTYALENPDKLFIYDLSLVSDHRLFPDTSQGIPDNVLFWGGYPARSPSWYRTLAKFGITELNASIFLRDDVLLASTDAEPWQCFMGYIRETAGETLDWSFYDIYGYLYFMQLTS